MKYTIKFSILFFVLAFVFSCKPSGDKAETSEAGEVANAEGKTYAVQTGSSQIMWEASKVSGTHNGTVNIDGGKLVMDDGKLTGGNFTIDMTTINVLDLEGDQKNNLEAHLKGTVDEKKTDFFNVREYPNANFEMTKATQLLNNADANYIISGNLKLKDQTKQITFKAMVNESNGTITATTPQFTIDRTEWGIKYGSATFFDGLKDNAINDEVGLRINLSAK